MSDIHADGATRHIFTQTQRNSPGIFAVEAERDLIHTAWVSHYKVKTRLKTEESFKTIFNFTKW